MNRVFERKQDTSTVKLSGKIANYKCVRSSASFVFLPNDQRMMGIVAIAENSGDTDEFANYLEFDLNGASVKGWVWHSPFREGDVVDVAAERRGDYYEAYGIVRPVDRTIALYPHCSRSKGRHIKNAVKWWAICSVIFYLFTQGVAAYIGGWKFVTHPSMIWISGLSTLFFVPMFFSLSRQFMPFVRLSEKVFVVLGLPNAKDIDLVQSSKHQRTAEDPAEFGTFYFRY